MTRRIGLLGGCILLATGCVSVRAPERITIGTAPPEPVDSARLPATSSHEECRAELEKAYQNVQYLEQQLARAERKADELKRERDEARRALKKHDRE
jgi:hypothetical protein